MNDTHDAAARVQVKLLREAGCCAGPPSSTARPSLNASGGTSMSDNDVTLALVPVVDALNAAGVAYRVGGSVASSALGVPRSTLDVDVVCAMREEHVGAFVNALSNDYYVDADMIREAIRTRGSFNVIHLKTMLKVDLFISKGDAFSRASFARVIRRPLGEVLDVDGLLARAKAEAAG